jgi:hypothetical protein
MTTIGLLQIPAATIAALVIVAALRWAYGDGPGSGRCRPWPLTGLVVAIGAFIMWRILHLQDGVLTIFDATAGILGGILIASVLKAAWADGPFERTPKGQENTPLLVMLFASVLAVTALWLGAASIWNEPQMPNGGVYVETLPPGNWQ